MLLTSLWWPQTTKNCKFLHLNNLLLRFHRPIDNITAAITNRGYLLIFTFYIFCIFFCLDWSGLLMTSPWWPKPRKFANFWNDQFLKTLLLRLVWVVYDITVVTTNCKNSRILKPFSFRKLSCFDWSGGIVDITTTSRYHEKSRIFQFCNCSIHSCFY